MIPDECRREQNLNWKSELELFGNQIALSATTIYSLVGIL